MAWSSGHYLSITFELDERMKKLFVGNLLPTTTEDSLRALFTPYGKVRSLNLVKDLFSGKCKGFGFLEMEGHEARAAMAELNGKSINGYSMKVRYEAEKSRGFRGR
jgi:RNA recognition motif-containing protein